jgi:5-methylcytosine-specific restriction endonuclease McrBC regulatory subunit McrC
VGWTADERGLAGIGDSSGLAWRMDMEVAFEAWVEALVARIAPLRGRVVRSGRKDGTRISLDWAPRGQGSLRSLLPDVVFAREDLTVVIDAKYKPHGEDVARGRWSMMATERKEAHRHDVHQALAYAGLYATERVVAVLAYPCASADWRDLRERGLGLSRAVVPANGRSVELAIVALHFGGPPDEAGEALQEAMGLAAWRAWRRSRMS